MRNKGRNESNYFIINKIRLYSSFNSVMDIIAFSNGFPVAVIYYHCNAE